MIQTSKCFERRCKHYKGIRNDGDEATERHFCAAFPDGIPFAIAYGDDPHDKPAKGQKNDIVFEYGAFEWEK